MRIDKETREEIAKIVRQTIAETLAEQFEAYEERWVTPKVLSEYISTFSKDFIKKHGNVLPREKSVMTDDEGNMREMNPTYPLHKIMRMMSQGAFRDIRVEKL